MKGTAQSLVKQSYDVSVNVTSSIFEDIELANSVLMPDGVTEQPIYEYISIEELQDPTYEYSNVIYMVF